MRLPLSGYPALLLLTCSVLLLGASSSMAEGAKMLLYRAPLAGAQYHELGPLAAQIKVGDLLQLVREPGNRHDEKAIRVEWQGRLLGYVPRADNRGLATAMDAGERLSGRVIRILDDSDPWRRLQFDIYLEF